MAEAVERALEREENLVVEAGTGVGKSLAYLIPAAAWAVRGARRVLVSTHTRALQEQLVAGDLPVVARVLADLGLPLKHALLMGSENYLCVQRLSALRRRPDASTAEWSPLLERLDAWSAGAPGGHRAALPESVPDSLWGKIARDPEICRGPGGPAWERCLWRRDRERADKAHLVVVNHALLLSGARLPPYDALIVDEAHNLEEAAVSRFGREVSLGRARSLAEEVALASRLSGEAALSCAAESAQADCERFLRAVAADHGVGEGDEDSSGRLLETAPASPPAALAGLEAALAQAAAAAEGRAWEADLHALHARAAQLNADLDAILKPAPATARWVAWGRRGPELRSAPLDAGRRLSEGLFARGVPAILTSATLAAGDGLAGFRARSGVGEARELTLESPYDYRAQAALWCVEGLPDPADEDAYAKAAAELCAGAIARVPGGTFLLFPSWKLLRKVHAILKRKIKDRPLWTQGTAGHEALLERFAQAGNGVLLGVDTFWQGVDVPGPALSCVVLVKLPFANVRSPLEQARRRHMEENDGDYFRGWSLPKAVMKFRQGFGRLIRSGRDRGAVVVLDPRLRAKGYGKAFLSALPECRRIESLEELAAFFKPREDAPVRS